MRMGMVMAAMLTAAGMIAGCAGGEACCGGGRDEGDFIRTAWWFKPAGELEQQKAFGRYVVRIYRGIDDSSFELLHDGKRVYALHAQRFFIGAEPGEDHPAPAGAEAITAMGKDLTGDGTGDLLITEYTGGAHCCFLLHLFELGEKPRYIQTISCGDGAGVFENLDKDAAVEIRIQDWTFAYWHECFMRSPAPDVILKYNGSRYVMSPELMRTPPPSEEKLRETAAEIAGMKDWAPARGEALIIDKIAGRDFGADEGWVPTALWAEMLDRIYSGNMSAAWRLADLAWAGKKVSKEDFLREFREQLATSPYWPELRKMNEGKRP